MSQKPTILVVGGAGYIGSHTVQALHQVGYPTIILDNLVNGHRDLVEKVLQGELIVGDVGDRALLDELFTTRSIGAVMHFAAFALVGESFLEPAKYYRNNVAGTLTLLEAMVAASVNNLVFSSSCATYGIPTQIPIAEDAPQQPINPYGASKLMAERIIQDFERAYGLKSTIFRFFNAAGADAAGRLGEDHTPEPHLIPAVLLTALGQRESEISAKINSPAGSDRWSISIFGTDYPTPDGSCIRDYIHVADLAIAHIQGLEYLLEQGRSNIFNLGNGSGFSVRQVIETAVEVTGKKIEVKECDRRLGDPPILVANSEKARRILGWQPKYPDLKDIISHAWNWHQQRHGIKKPLVSVIIPAYNAEKFIERTLQSVLAQTYKNFEVLVVDDGSKDRTAAIVESVAQKDSRVTLLKQSNLGVAAARNLAIAHSVGEFIAPIDADDIWYEENIEKQIQCFQQSDANVGLVYSWSVDIDANDALLGGFRAAKIEGEVYNTLICHNFLGNASASLIRRTCLNETAYNCQMKLHNAQGCEDWELYLRIAENYEFRVVPEFLVGYRRLSNTMSGDYYQMARSHNLIVQTVRQKYPQLSTIIYRLSSSNLYMYFAHQNNRCGKHRETLFWLYKALQADLVTPFMRYGLYRLLVASISGMIGQLAIAMTNTPQSQRNGKQQLVRSTLTKADIEQRKLLINLMVIIGDLFHQLIGIITNSRTKNKGFKTRHLSSSK